MFKPIEIRAKTYSGLRRLGLNLFAQNYMDLGLPLNLTEVSYWWNLEYLVLLALMLN